MEPELVPPMGGGGGVGGGGQTGDVTWKCWHVGEKGQTGGRVSKEGRLDAVSGQSMDEIGGPSSNKVCYCGLIRRARGAHTVG